MFRLASLFAASLVLGFAAVAVAAETEFTLRIINHRFEPSEITIPANTRVKLIVDNHDAEPEEFDSHPLNREKVIPGKSKATIFIGPLAPGRYAFMGEFHADTARGTVIVAP
jgi:plastocyanin